MPTLTLSRNVNLEPLKTKKGVFRFWEIGHCVVPHYLTAAEVTELQADVKTVGGKKTTISGKVILLLN